MSARIQGARAGIVAPIVVLAATIALICASFKMILRLPGVPYNVAELFLDHASIPRLAIFSLAILWIGAGAMLLARWLVLSPQPYLVLPVGAIAIAMVSRTLLKYSVTYESLDDILGSSSLWDQVTRDKIFGEFWNHAFLVTNVPNLIEYFERRTRYTALYSLLAVTLAVMLVPIARAGERRARRPWPAWALAASAVVWLWLSKFIVINLADTDNITELIAVGGPLGVGGVPFLFAILVLMATSVALLVYAAERRTPAAWLGAIVLMLAAIGWGWFLLQMGLEQHVEKYGLVFSGQQFLLGPDRQHTITPLMLFIRWTVVQGGGVMMMFIGAWIAYRLLPATTEWRSRW